MGAVEQHRPSIGTRPVCEALGVARSSYYRRRQAPSRPAAVSKPRPRPDRALSPAERQEVLDLLNSERFMDKSPGQVVATQLDENRYLCSERTMYRILADAKEVRERRNPAAPTGVQAPGAAGHRAQPGLGLGHHQAQGSQTSWCAGKTGEV